MDKRTVIVTGGSRGIGEAISTRFAKEGYNVVINYVSNDERASKLKKDLEEKYNADILLVKADVSNEDDAKRLIDEAVNKFGTIDCLVNNAGIAIDKPFLDKTKDDFMKTLSTNLVGPFLTSKFAYNYLINASNAAIVNISSTNGIDTLYPESIDYDASKAGVISLTKNLANVYAPNVRVNSVAPGWVETEMNSELDKDFMKEEEDKILLGRFAKPEEIAKVVYFLCSSEASYINGEVIIVDGGAYGS
ncbi:MAG: glucose 1-dehydrogenase [Bacilli bacterium]|nr:glucose 1-dehydrogenase [Bacilli bacterium]